MARTATIATDLWTDHFFEDLSLRERLVYLHLLTNAGVSIFGVYRLVKENAVRETGLSPEDYEQAFLKLEKLGLIRYSADKREIAVPEIPIRGIVRGGAVIEHGAEREIKQTRDRSLLEWQIAQIQRAGDRVSASILRVANGYGSGSGTGSGTGSGSAVTVPPLRNDARKPGFQQRTSSYSGFEFANDAICGEGDVV